MDCISVYFKLSSKLPLILREKLSSNYLSLKLFHKFHLIGAVLTLIH